MKMLTRLYEMLVAECAICEEYLFMNDKSEVCKKVLFTDGNDTAYDVLIINGDVKEIVEY